MRHRRPNQSQAVQTVPPPTDDLFAFAQRQVAKPAEEELWSIKVVKLRTGLSRATVYKYIELGLFPRQRHLGPGRVAWLASEVRAWIESRPE